MTDDTTSNNGTDSSSAAALIDLGTPDEIDLGTTPDEEDDDDNLADELTETDDEAAGSRAPGSGALSGGFGLAGLALAVVSLTTNWTSGVVIGHAQYVQEMNAPSSGLTAQQQLNMYADAWRTQGWWALAFAAAAVLFGAGALLFPWIQRGRGALPGWARAIATGAVVVGLVGLLLAVLTVVGVFGGHLTAPTSAG